MRLTLSVLGYEIASVDVDLGEEPGERRVPVLDRGIKRLSTAWVRRMNS